MELGKLFIPTLIDYKSKSKKITLRHPEYLTDDYINDSECYLKLDFVGDIVFIDYYCEDGFTLSEIFNLDGGFASGDLENETFGVIQERAFKKLMKYLDKSQSKQEMIEYFQL